MDNRRNTVAQEEIVVNVSSTEALTPAQITAKAEDLGITKTEMPFSRSFMLSIMAGAFIAMGAMFFCLVVGDPSLPFAVQRVFGGLLFCLGLILVVVAGAELFTGNTMIVMTAASKRIRWSAVWKNWIVVFIGNFIGALVIVGIVFLSEMPAMNGGQVGQTMVSVAAGKMHAGWLALFAKGIMCNFLVCLGVWMAYAAKTVADKVLAVIFPITAFVACGFEHCVANMFFLPMGALLASLGIAPAGIDPATVDMMGALYNWSATVPGNIVGGAVFVGLVYWFVYSKKNR